MPTFSADSSAAASSAALPSPPAVTAAPSAVTRALALPDVPTGALAVVSFNIHHGEAPDGRYDLHAVAEVLRLLNPALVALQEVDSRWGARSRFDDQPALLAELTGLHPCYGPNLVRGGARYGNLILSRFPILECVNTPLPRTGESEPRGLLEAVVDAGGTRLRLCATHLQHNNPDERLAQAQAIAALLAGRAEPAILAGDFNARPDDDALRPLFETLVDAWPASGAAGPGGTFPSGAPRARIDYVLVPRGATVFAATVSPVQVSDHRPLAVWLARPSR